MKAKELREKTEDELDQILSDRMSDIMHFRLQMATGVVDNVKGGQDARRDIARIKTIRGERTRSSQGSGV